MIGAGTLPLYPIVLMMRCGASSTSTGAMRIVTSAFCLAATAAISVPEAAAALRVAMCSAAAFVWRDCPRAAPSPAAAPRRRKSRRVEGTSLMSRSLHGWFFPVGLNSGQSMRDAPALLSMKYPVQHDARHRGRAHAKQRTPQPAEHDVAEDATVER